MTASARFQSTADGRLWTRGTSLAYGFWTRYLGVYEGVILLVRVSSAREVSGDVHEVTGPGISFVGLPDTGRPLVHLLQYPRIRAAVQDALDEVQAIHFRSPCTTDPLVVRMLSPGHPYGVEVVGDPYDVFAPGAVRHLLRPLFRWLFTRRQRRLCAHACAASYVTAQALQRRYPPAADAFATHYSSIELPPEAFASAPRSWLQMPDPARLVFVGTLAQLYKAPDVLLAAVARCRAQGLPVTLTILGDGKHRAELEALASTLGLSDAVQFLGQVPAGAAVRQQLDRADLFVLPSRQEGLPRAMIEAMARGLPCIGSTVGGIPELLPAEHLVPPGDAVALADKIAAVLRDPARMTAMSQRNLAKAREYADAVLHERRVAFYRYVKECTQEWLNQIR